MALGFVFFIGICVNAYFWFLVQMMEYFADTEAQGHWKIFKVTC